MELFVKHLCNVIIKLAASKERLELDCGILSDIGNGRRELCQVVFVSIECRSNLRRNLGNISSESLAYCNLLRSRIGEGTNCNIGPRFHDFTSKAIADSGSSQRGKCLFQRDIFPSNRILSALDHFSNHPVLLIFEDTEQ